jgi:FAD/FMN-containing dehydrogenase
VTVQPGVIRDELNLYLKPHGVFFRPNTSTSSRCMIGGMVGNNSSGTTSIRYGCNPDKIVEIKAILSDGSAAVFADPRQNSWQKTKGNTLESSIYKNILRNFRIKKLKTK